MFNSKIKTPEDLKEAAKRARAAQIEEERRPRIFDVKQRIIGMDQEALKKQIQEKEVAKAALKAEDEAYLALQKYEAKKLKEIESRIEEERKRYLAEMLQFRKQHQTKEQRREFDLNDPHFKRKDIPCRLGDDDPRLTISSMQKFEGDEGSAGDRKRIQREQIKAWLDQQIKEKRDTEAARAAAEEAVIKAAAANDKRVLELDEAEKKCRREIDAAVRQYNYQLYKEKEAAQELKKKQDKEDLMMHINNMMNSDLLSGNPGGQPSQLFLDKCTKSSFRGMSPADIEKIKEYQLQQIEEHEMRKREQAQADVDWLKLAEIQANLYIEKKVKNNDEKRKAEQEVLEENRLLAEKQKAQRRFLDEHVYKSPGPEPYFYEQFNKTTR